MAFRNIVSVSLLLRPVLAPHFLCQPLLTVSPKDCCLTELRGTRLEIWILQIGHQTSRRLENGRGCYRASRKVATTCGTHHKVGAFRSSDGERVTGPFS